MKLIWDAKKHASNLVKNGVDFASVERFQWKTALSAEDIRRDYGETRYQVIGYAGGVLHVLIYTPRGNSIRAISLRKATPKERIRYAQAQKQADPSAT